MLKIITMMIIMLEEYVYRKCQDNSKKPRNNRLNSKSPNLPSIMSKKKLL